MLVSKVAKYAPNKNNGLALLKFLSSDIGQSYIVVKTANIQYRKN